jgi:hypothetical protein
VTERQESVETFPGRNGGTLRRGGSPGRPKGQVEVASYLRSHLFTDGPNDRIGILDALLNQARKGNIRAIELCLWYGVGKPTETIDMTVRLREYVATFAAERGIEESLALAEVDALLDAARTRR